MTFSLKAKIHRRSGAFFRISSSLTQINRRSVRPLCVKMALICKNGLKVKVRVRVRDRIRVRVRDRVRVGIRVSISSLYR